MFFIAHRGNLNGPSEKENSPDYIYSALYNGFHVEVDVWVIDQELYLGHDSPEYKIDRSFLQKIKDKLFIHCKNMESLSYFIEINDDFNFFWHEEDDYTLTSKGQAWAYPGKKIDKNCICVMPERSDEKDIFEGMAICTDYPFLYSDLHRKQVEKNNEKS